MSGHLPPAGPVRAEPRPPSEFADQTPLLIEFARLPATDPRRGGLRDQLIVTFLPVAERLAARYSSANPWSREDLRQAASIGVINAIDRWDPELAGDRDVLSFLVPSVRGEILRWFRDRTWSVRVPRRLKELGVGIRRITGPLTHQLGRAPRPSELARELGADVEEVLEALRAEESHHTSALDAPGHDGIPLSERIGSIDPNLDTVEDVEVVRPLLDRLPERERRIVVLRFYGGRTQSEIAREIGISQMHVSRLLARTLAQMRATLTADPQVVDAALPAA